MLFSVDHAHADVEQRPYLLTQDYILLLDQEGKPLSRVWTFDTDTGIGTRQDGSTVQVHSFRWHPPTEEARARVLRLLPERYHAFVVGPKHKNEAPVPS